MRAAASRAAATHSLRLSFHEARCALEAVRLRTAARPRWPPTGISGAFQLLLSLQDDDALISYCRSVLGPVEQGEGDYGDELLRSLDVFIEHNGHWEKAAGALYCHRHTLRYRIAASSSSPGVISQARAIASSSGWHYGEGSSGEAGSRTLVCTNRSPMGLPVSVKREVP